MKKRMICLFLCIYLLLIFFQNSKSITASTTVDISQPVVALSFDDGPSKYTEKIINYLHEEDVVATFFVVGNKVPLYQKTLKKAIKYKNEIGNHSYSHKWLSRLNDMEMKEEIEKGNSVIKEELGYTTKLLRPTYGGINQRLRDNTNLQIVFWSVDTKDWKYKNVQSIVKETENTKDGDIILMHDLHERTLKALKEIIPLLKEKNFEFVTVSELEKIKFLRNKIKK